MELLDEQPRGKQDYDMWISDGVALGKGEGPEYVENISSRSLKKTSDQKTKSTKYLLFNFLSDEIDQNTNFAKWLFMTKLYILSQRRRYRVANSAR